jgi:hypothetical protein
LPRAGRLSVGEPQRWRTNVPSSMLSLGYLTTICRSDIPASITPSGKT